MWQEFLPSRSSWVGSDILLGSCICTNEGSEVPSPLSLHLHRESGVQQLQGLPARGRGPRPEDGRRCCGLNPSREGTALPLGRLLPHFLSRRRERKSCAQAKPGAFRRHPPPSPTHSQCVRPGSSQVREAPTYSYPWGRKPQTKAVAPAARGRGGGKGR